MGGEDFRGKATGVIGLSKVGAKVALTSVMGSQGAESVFTGEVKTGRTCSGGWRWVQLWLQNVFTPFKLPLSPTGEVKCAL